MPGTRKILRPLICGTRELKFLMTALIDNSVIHTVKGRLVAKVVLKYKTSNCQGLDTLETKDVHDSLRTLREGFPKDYPAQVLCRPSCSKSSCANSKKLISKEL